jgi:head-tail adaptor
MSADLVHFDHLEPVTLQSPAGQAHALAALRRPVATSEAEPSGGAYTKSDLAWHLPAGAVDEAVRPGATIVDAAGVSWIVERAELSRPLGQWRCWCRRLELADSLAQRITVQRAVWQYDAAGAAVPIWIDLRTDVPARIQPLDQSIEPAGSGRASRARYRIFVAEPIPVDEHHRVVCGGAVYRLTGTEMAERIDRLLVLLAERDDV